MLTRSAAALKGVLAYFDHAPGEAPEHDLYMARVESILPLADHHLTVITCGNLEQEKLVELEVDPPNHRGEFVSTCVQRLNDQGIPSAEPELDTGWMYTWISPPDDLGWSEQVLDWDDVYTNEQWGFLSGSTRLFVSFRPSSDLLEDGLLAGVAKTIALTRQELDNDYNVDLAGTGSPLRKVDKLSSP